MTHASDPQITPQLRADIIAQAMPYIKRFHGKTIVIKYGGNAMTDVSLQQSFAQDVALLKLMGLNPVIVHGGGPQINQALERVGKKGEFIQGMRVTDAETMQIVQWVLAGQVQQDIVTMINQAGGKAVGLTGRDASLIHANKSLVADEKNPSQLVDIGFVGRITAVNPEIVQTLQDGDFIPVISPIGYNPEDNCVYNINADVVSGQIAQALGTEKLLLMTNTPGVLNQAGELITHLDGAAIQNYIQDGTISGGMIPKINSALFAAQNGVNAVHILDGRVPHSLLLEVLTQTNIGTMITA